LRFVLGFVLGFELGVGVARYQRGSWRVRTRGLGPSAAADCGHLVRARVRVGLTRTRTRARALTGALTLKATAVTGREPGVRAESGRCAAVRSAAVAGRGGASAGGSSTPRSAGASMNSYEQVGWGIKLGVGLG
jgi:hypothetical protein